MSSPTFLFPQVAEQPLWFSDSVPNVRKLQELPLHLLSAGRVQELKQEVLGEAAPGRATHLHAETGGVCLSICPYVHHLLSHSSPSHASPMSFHVPMPFHSLHPTITGKEV